MGLEIIILSQCERELKELSDETLEDFLDAVSKLQNGLVLSMPLSRNMSNVYPGLHELRFKDRGGIYRVFYLIKKSEAIYIVHTFKKKTQKIPIHNIKVLKNRLKNLNEKI